jgi:hypothetical protein
MKNTQIIITIGLLWIVSFFFEPVAILETDDTKINLLI